MPFSPDILLPNTAKYIYLRDRNISYNSDFDITWSFALKLSTTNSLAQGLVCTGLTPSLAPEPDINPGHFGCMTPNNLSLINSVSVISAGSITQRSPFNVISIAFDTTGYFAVSTLNRNEGIQFASALPNSIVIRDITNRVIFNTNSIVSAGIDALGNWIKNQDLILRINYSNSRQEVNISYRPLSSISFTSAATVKLDYTIVKPNNAINLFPFISFCSPISTTQTANYALLLSSFHYDGITSSTAVETITSATLS
jgi:hypothetical protein